MLLGCLNSLAFIKLNLKFFITCFNYKIIVLHTGQPSRILQPISLNTIINASKKVRFDVKQEVPCLLCNKNFPATENGVKNPVLAHLLSEHQLIIADVEKVADFPK